MKAIQPFDQTDAEPLTVTRRGFVKTGAAAMLLAAVPAGAAEVAKALAGPSAANTILSVGYWDGLFHGDATERITSHLVPAAGMVSDSAFSRGSALVTVYGFWRAPQNRFVKTSMSVIGLYPQGESASAPAIGWNAAMIRSGLTSSRRSQFNVPVDAKNTLRLAIDRTVEGGRRRAVPSSPFAPSDLDQIRALSLDATSIMTLGPDAPLGLKKGFYFVALRDRDGMDSPDWTRLHSGNVRSLGQIDPDGESLLVLSDESSPVSFDYIVMTIEPHGVSAA